MFFIPYAGSLTCPYYKWKNLFDERFEPCFIEFAGRGGRSNIDFYEDIDGAAEDISEIIASKTNSDDYLIFGHSMGAVVAFEVYYKLLEKNLRLPKHMFFSGKDAPQLECNREKIYKYNDDMFLNMVSFYGGLPEYFQDEEIRRIFLPILRADFKMLCDYVYSDKPEKIKCNISVLLGENDFSTKLSEIEQWKVHAGNGFDSYIFEGDHFFINHKYPTIVKLILDSIL